MTPEDKQKLDEYLVGISEILAKNTPPENLKDFETIEVTVREHLLSTVAPGIGSFFFKFATKTTAGRTRKVNTCIGKMEITQRQAEKLGLKKNSRLSPFLEKCCLRLVASEYESKCRERHRNDDRNQSIAKQSTPVNTKS